jgi:hypothetical protein
VAPKQQQQEKPYKFSKKLREELAPLGVDFVTRMICAFDTRRLQFEAVTTGLASCAIVREPARRPVEVTVQVGVGRLGLPQRMDMSLVAISNEGEGWRCPKVDAAAAELLASPDVQLLLDATSAIFRAREHRRAEEFAAEHLPSLHIQDCQLRDQDTKEWFTRRYAVTLESYDEVLIAHSAWGLFDWLRKTKQVGGRRSMSGASAFVERQLAHFHAERELAALIQWNSIK